MVFIDIIQTQLINIIQFIIVITIGVVITKFTTDGLKYFFNKPDVRKTIQEFGYDQPLVDLIILIARYILYFLAVIIGISQFGFATIIFDAIVILIILLIAFLIVYSLKDVIPNVVAGIYLHSTKSFVPGEVITVGVYHGRIQELTLMTTMLKDQTGRIIIIPNANLTRKEIIKEKPLKKSKKK